MTEPTQAEEMQEAVNTVLGFFDIEPSFDNMSQFMVLLEALQVYASRTAAYGTVWEQYGAMSNLLSVARKTDRLMSVWWTEEMEDVPAKPKLHKDNLDDAIDLLNYTVFFIRNARRANLFGSVPTRPEDVKGVAVSGPDPVVVHLHPCPECGSTDMAHDARVHKQQPGWGNRR